MPVTNSICPEVGLRTTFVIVKNINTGSGTTSPPLVMILLVMILLVMNLLQDLEDSFKKMNHFIQLAATWMKTLTVNLMLSKE